MGGKNGVGMCTLLKARENWLTSVSNYLILAQHLGRLHPLPMRSGAQTVAAKVSKGPGRSRSGKTQSRSWRGRIRGAAKNTQSPIAASQVHQEEGAGGRYWQKRTPGS